MGDVGRLGDGGDPALIQDGQAPRTNGERFPCGVHEAVFDLDEAIRVPNDFETFLPAKLFVFFSGQSAAFFREELKGDPIVVESVALIVFGRGPESVSPVDHPLFRAGLAHLVFVFKKYVRSIDRAKAKNAGTDFQWGDQFPSVPSHPDGLGPTSVGNEIEREAHSSSINQRGIEITPDFWRASKATGLGCASDEVSGEIFQNLAAELLHHLLELFLENLDDLIASLRAHRTNSIH